MRTFFFMVVFWCHPLNGGAQGKDDGEMLRPFDRDVITITWLQNIADGNWVDGGDLNRLAGSKYGTRKMLPREAQQLSKNVQGLRKRWGGLAIFLRGYRYDDVEIVWKVLSAEARKAELYEHPIMIVQLIGENDGPNFRKTSIRELYAEAKKLRDRHGKK